MEQKNGATDDFLDGLEEKIQDPFEPTNSDDLFPDDKEEVIESEHKEESVEEKVPFYKLAKDEKFQRFFDKKLEREVEKRMKDLKPSAQETFTKDVSESGDTDLVSAFTAIIGNDTPEKIAALTALERSLKNVDERATKKAVEHLQQVQEDEATREAKEIEEAESQLEDGFEEIESHYGINLTDPQKEAYKKFLIRIEPKGGYKEYPDFVETFEVFKSSIKRPSNSQAKALASRGMERSSASQVTTPTLVREGTKSLWQSVEKML